MATQTAAVALAFYLLAGVAARFANLYGASYVFPNAALILVAGAGFGWAGVAGIYIGSLFATWGAASTPAGMLVFSLIHSGTAAIPAIALRAPGRPSRRRIERTIVYGAILNNLFSAVAGTAYLILSGRLNAGVAALQVGTLWWISDLMAAVVLGIPALLLLRPATLLSKWDRDLYGRWLRQRRHILATTGLLLGAATVLFLFNTLQIGFRDWMAVLLLVPIGYAAFFGGVGAAILANLGASLIYIAAVLQTTPLLDAADIATALGPVYLMLILMAATSIVAGLLIGANRLLIHRLERNEKLLERDFERIVTTLSAAIEAKDPLTLGHVERVAAMAVEVGRRCGLDEDSLMALRFGALLHDVGKIGIPEQILNKPGELNESEQQIMQRHVEHGIRIIGRVRTLQGVLPLIRYHQERWDGATSGVTYPGYFGLKRDEIPLGARILSAVDSYDAITNDRPYRAAQPPRAAVAELRREAGRQFDPRVVEVIAAMIEEADQESTATLHA
jgi:HD-GYP domain-containing protein (c-di-GMP phosphodiesterase class II)